MQDDVFGPVIGAEYARLEATRPCRAASGPLDDGEMLQIWEFVDHKELLDELGYEFCNDGYLGRNGGVLAKIRDYLIREPDAAAGYFEHVWEAYYNEGFSRGGLELIAESSEAWLAGQG